MVDESDQDNCGISCCVCTTEMINNEPFYWACLTCCPGTTYNACHFCAFSDLNNNTASFEQIISKRKATKKKQVGITTTYEKSQDLVEFK